MQYMLKEEVNIILDRFKNNHAMYYAFLTAYYTGLRVSEVCGNSTTVWYFGPCKTESSYRIIEIGDTLVNALKQYKEELDQHKKEYGDSYMKHYIKKVVNPYNK